MLNILKEFRIIEQKINNFVECKPKIIDYIDVLIKNQKLNKELLKKTDETLSFLRIETLEG